MLKKLALVFVAATLGTSAVACSSGPPEEFCDAAAEYFALDAGLTEAAAEGPEAAYAELQTAVPEMITALETMEDTADDDEVKTDIVAVREVLEGYVETGETDAIANGEIDEAVRRIADYSSECEGVEAGVDTDAAEDDDEAADATADLESVVKNAATANESYLTGNGTYTDSVEDLEGEGLQVPEGVTVTVEADGGTAYCITAEDAEGTTVHYDSEAGEPAEGGC